MTNLLRIVTKTALVLALCVFCVPAAYALEESRLVVHHADKSYVFSVEIAKTKDEQRIGLMHRQALDKNQGMLFPQSPEREMHMWMKDTEIPLDMLFIDSIGRIVYIAPQTVPNSMTVISANRPVRAVLELAGGVVAEKNIRVGDRVEHEIFAP